MPQSTCCLMSHRDFDDMRKELESIEHSDISGNAFMLNLRNCQNLTESSFRNSSMRTRETSIKSSPRKVKFRNKSMKSFIGIVDPSLKPLF